MHIYFDLVFLSLDVYKRQVCRLQQLPDTFDTALTQPRGGRVAENPLETPAEGNRAGIPANPVSYTHLDVYKRQPPTWTSTA